MRFGAGGDLGEGALGRIDAADPDEDELIADLQAQPRQQGRGALEEGPAGEAAGLACLGIMKTVARERRIGDDHAVDAKPHGDVGNRHGGAIVEVGGDLEEDRQRPLRRGTLAHGDDPRQQLGQRRALLQVAQARRVRRGNVDDHIGCDIGEARDPGDIIADALGAVPVRPEIDADDATAAARRQAPMQRVVAVIVEAEAVDDGPVGRQPEDARARIALLRQGRDRADLDEAEAEIEERVDHFAVLVEAGGEPERIGKVEIEHPAGEPRVGERPAGNDVAAETVESEPMCLFRIEAEEKWPEQRIDRFHGCTSGRTGTPSASRLIGFTQSTAPRSRAI